MAGLAICYFCNMLYLGELLGACIGGVVMALGVITVAAAITTWFKRYSNLNDWPIFHIAVSFSLRVSHYIRFRVFLSTGIISIMHIV